METIGQSEEISAAILFPGQGLPPKEICSYYQLLTDINPDLVKQHLSLAQQALEKIHGGPVFNMTAALSDESSADFQKTSFVQPVVYTLSVLAFEILGPRLKLRNIEPKVMAGHSLGEYSALTAAGVVPFEKGVEIVTFRGMVMQEACNETPSKLVSIRGLAEDLIQKGVCQKSLAMIALINAPDLIVVGCAEEDWPAIEQLAQDIGLRGEQRVRVRVLDTAGAFHTHFMAEAARRLDGFLSDYQFKDPRHPIVANLTGDISRSGTALRNHLFESMTSPVRWAKSLQTIKELGIHFFVESGPGSSMTDLNVLNGIPREQTININSLI